MFHPAPSNNIEAFVLRLCKLDKILETTAPVQTEVPRMQSITRISALMLIDLPRCPPAERICGPKFSHIVWHDA